MTILPVSRSATEASGGFAAYAGLLIFKDINKASISRMRRVLRCQRTPAKTSCCADKIDGRVFN